MNQHQVFRKALNTLGTTTKVYARDSDFTTKDGIVNLHPTKSTRLTKIENKSSFNSVASGPQNLQRKISKREKQNVFFPNINS